jgi:RNA-directed DNA polymerase
MPADPPYLLTRGNVADLLGLPLNKLTWWVWALSPDRRYRTFEIARRSSDVPRVISAPIKPIKDIQRRLAHTLTDIYDPPPQVHGFVRGKDPRSNAQAHPGQHWVLRADIEDFFGMINFGRVRGLFMSHPFDYPHEVATLLAQVCCHRNQLPQGAPTSPIVSNLICRGLDKDLARLAAIEHCYFTRYADDLCFSTDRRRFPSALATLEAGETSPGGRLESVVEEHGFKLNLAKTKLTESSQRQRITGLVVNSKVNVSRDYVRSLRNLIHIWNRFGEGDAREAFARHEPRLNWPPGKPEPEFAFVIRGRVEHVGYVRGDHDPVYLNLVSRLADADPDFVPRQPPDPPDRRARLYTEGSTDIQHIHAALAWFQARGLFKDLQLITDSNSDAGGDSELLAMCKSLRKAPHGDPCLCLFDTDNEQILRKAVDAGGVKDWGNDVSAVALVKPGFRADEEGGICIEMLFRDEVLQSSTDEGRRVWLRPEFDPETGRHLDGIPCYTPHAGGRGPLVIDQVYSLSDPPEQLALRKSEFASAVEAKEPPYEQIDFEGFAPTFERIRGVLR